MGKLVAPLELVIREETGYFLFTEQGRFAEPKIAAFRNWLQAEVAGDTPGRCRTTSRHSTNHSRARPGQTNR